MEKHAYDAETEDSSRELYYLLNLIQWLSDRLAGKHLTIVSSKASFLLKLGSNVITA